VQIEAGGKRIIAIITPPLLGFKAAEEINYIATKQKNKNCTRAN
jgi:hypothetical protein